MKQRRMDDNRIRRGIRCGWLIVLAAAMFVLLPWMSVQKLAPWAAETAQVHAAAPAYTGSGTQADPILIRDSSDLESIRQQVRAGENFAGKYLRLEADIRLPADWPGLGDLKDGTSTTGNGANIMPFSGTLDGKGSDDTIHTVTAADGGHPLFAYVRQATIRNLNIAGTNINGSGLIGDYTVDYGPTGSGSGVPAASIRNVTIKSGATIRGSGFVSGYAAAGNTIDIAGCAAEPGVIIGCDKDREKIGSFAGDYNGVIRNCASAATVYGTDYVGGIIGCKSNSMSRTDISGCAFTGRVIASGSYAGGIAGGGYGGTGWGIESAPNAPCLSITDCLVTGSVTANNAAGGILGYETCLQAWSDGTGYLRSDLFAGRISTTAAGKNAIAGGLVGQLRGIDKYNIIGNNYYASNCGADRGIGGAGYVDTSSGSHETAARWMDADGTVRAAMYLDTSQEVPTIVGVNDVYAHNLKADHNRADDPLGADADALAKAVTAGQLSGAATVGNTGRSLVELLNGMAGDERWIQGAATPMIVNAGSDPSGEDPGGGDSGGGSSGTIQVSFTLLGDSCHPDEDSVVHTRAAGNLQQWLPKKEYTLSSGSSAWDLIRKALADSGLDWQGTDNPEYGSYYISGVQIPGTFVYLREKNNGPNSGWMYAVNGEEPGVGVSRYTLEDGDDVILFYTDDFTKERSAAPYHPDDSVAAGNTVSIAGCRYRVLSVAAAEKHGTVMLIGAKNAKKITVPKTVRLSDQKTYDVVRISKGAFRGKRIRTVVIGANVSKISAGAFQKSGALKIILKTKRLKKTSVKGSLKGSKVKLIRVRVSKSSRENKRYVKKYRSYFTGKNAGKKVSVK